MWCVCVCVMCVRVKGEHTEVCMNVRVQEKKPHRRKAESTRECRVCSLKLRANGQERKRAESEREERETLSLEKLPVSLYPKKESVYIYYAPCRYLCPPPSLEQAALTWSATAGLAHLGWSLLT